MTTRILICDDSALARKHLVSALPADWDVSIQLAKDGNEALAQLQHHPVDVLFLDLNMPKLDGYQVLAAINERKLEVFTLVVSADIQPKALQQVTALGAMAFIKKPIVTQELASLLADYGLYRPTGQVAARDLSKVAAPISLEEQLQELANVAMGQASSLLAQLLGSFIYQPIPKVSFLERSELTMTLSALSSHKEYSGVCQGFIGSGIAGEALLLFSDTSNEAMAQLLHYDHQEAIAPEVEVLMDMSNILFGAFLKGLGEQLDIRFGLGQPSLLGNQEQLTALLRHHQRQTGSFLCIEIPYLLEQERINCNLLIIFAQGTAVRLEKRLAYLTE